MKSRESDSLTSLFYTWQKNQRPILANIQTGRTVTATEFFLFDVSIIFLVLGLGLVTISLWSIFLKMSYMYLVDYPMEVAYLILPSSLLCFPCFWVTLSVHNDEKSHKYLPLVIILLIFGICLTITATYISFTHSFQNKSARYDLAKGMNNTMFYSLKMYNNENYKTAWDKTQHNLQCCGVNNFTDWVLISNKVPKSCCRKNICLDNTTYPSGCLYPVMLELTSQISLIVGINCVTLFIEFCLFVAVTVIYLNDKRNKNRD